MQRVILSMIAVVCLSAAVRAESTQDQLAQLMQENLAACNEENLPRLLATMSEEMPQRDLFIQQTKAEWEVSDLYYRLDNVQIVKQNKWRAPYAVATVRQTITGNEGQVEDAHLSDIMSLNTKDPITESEILFKREHGKWKMVAGLTEPRPVGSKMVKEAATPGPCANGQCRWPKVR